MFNNEVVFYTKYYYTISKIINNIITHISKLHIYYWNIKIDNTLSKNIKLCNNIKKLIFLYF